MCGICGFVGFEDRALLKRMTDVIQHRGPDDSGFYTDSMVSLGHRRLSIIDLNTGKQPIHNEDESVWVVYNGEVYNFPELKKELENKGHRFYTHTDTEVLVHAYEEYGDSFVNKLNGMFAFAIWDSREKKLLLARDRLGIKPLYYTITPEGNLLFASEVKSILQHVKPELDLDALHYIVNVRYVPGVKTMFRGIMKLLPGHILAYQNKRKNIVKYWDAEFNLPQQEASEEYYIKTFRKILENAVKRHTISDVPVGAYLSGGIDTSTIVALMSMNSEKPVETFCMGFGEETDEFKDAKIIAEKYGTKHHEILIDSAQDLRLLPKAVWHVDMPKINLYPYILSEKTSKHVKVVQSGLGGDELFGGYVPRLAYVRKVGEFERKVPRFLRYIPEKIASGLVKLQSKHGRLEWDYYRNYLRAASSISDHARFYYAFRTFTQEDLGEVYSAKMKGMAQKPADDVIRPYFTNPKNGFLEQAFISEIKTVMVDDYLIIDDAMSMAHSLETRVPFLDAELLDFSFRLPSSMKIRGMTGKYVIKKAVSDLLPPEIIRKKKWGFTVNVNTWFRGELGEMASQILPEGFAVKEGYFKREFIEKILSHKFDRRLYRYYFLIWSLLAFEFWYRIYIINQDNLYRPKLTINELV